MFNDRVRVSGGDAGGSEQGFAVSLLHRRETAEMSEQRLRLDGANTRLIFSSDECFKVLDFAFSMRVIV